MPKSSSDTCGRDEVRKKEGAREKVSERRGGVRACERSSEYALRVGRGQEGDGLASDGRPGMVARGLGSFGAARTCLYLVTAFTPLDFVFVYG